MRHLKTFENFEINESFLASAFDIVKKKINNFLDANVAKYVSQGIDIVKNNQSSPEIQDLVDNIDNLSEDDKLKLFNLANEKDIMFDTFNNFSNVIYESFSLKNPNKIKKILSKITGYGVIFASLFHFVFRVFNTVFINSSIHVDSFFKSNTFATVCLMIGIIIGAVLLTKSEDETEDA
jgi:hypothetical protein